MIIDKTYLNHHGVKGMKWGVRTQESLQKVYLGNKLAHKILKTSKKMYSKNHVETSREKIGHDKTKAVLFMVGGKKVPLEVGRATSTAYS